MCLTGCGTVPECASLLYAAAHASLQAAKSHIPDRSTPCQVSTCMVVPETAVVRAEAAAPPAESSSAQADESATGSQREQPGEPGEEPAKGKKKKASKAAAGADIDALLAEIDGPQPAAAPDEPPQPPDAQAAEPAGKGKKKKKKGGAAAADEDDIDALLAQLDGPHSADTSASQPAAAAAAVVADAAEESEQPSGPAQADEPSAGPEPGKKGKKKKKGAAAAATADDDDIDALLAEIGDGMLPLSGLLLNPVCLLLHGWHDDAAHVCEGTACSHCMKCELRSGQRMLILTRSSCSGRPKSAEGTPAPEPEAAATSDPAAAAAGEAAADAEEDEAAEDGKVSPAPSQPSVLPLWLQAVVLLVQLNSTPASQCLHERTGTSWPGQLPLHAAMHSHAQPGVHHSEVPAGSILAL